MSNRLTALLAFLFVLQATTRAQTLTKSLELKFPGENGNNGGGVVWHPIYKKYFAYFAGNATYPITDFDEKGNGLITDPEHLINAGADLRGLWYNPVKRRLEFNGYDTAGIGHYVLNNQGMLNSIVIDAQGFSLPYANAIGVYNPDLDYIAFPNEYFVLYKYKQVKDGFIPEKLLALFPGCRTKQEADELADDDWEKAVNNRNKTVLYTGIPNGEYALLNVADGRIELYSAKTGLMTRDFALPDAAPVNTYFNFAYANKIWWLFDKTSRTWMGYQ